jgi:hypothetical protein
MMCLVAGMLLLIAARKMEGASLERPEEYAVIDDPERPLWAPAGKRFTPRRSAGYGPSSRAGPTSEAINHGGRGKTPALRHFRPACSIAICAG